MSQKSLVSKTVKADAISAGTQSKIPVQNISDLPPTKGAVMLNPADNKIYLGNGTTWTALALNAETQTTAASLGLTANQAAPGLHFINFDKSLLQRGTPTEQPDTDFPIFTGDGTGTLQCERTGVYKVELSTLLSHSGVAYPYLLTLGVLVNGGPASQTDVDVANATVSGSSTVQVELTAGDQLRFTFITDAPTPLLLPKGTNLLISRIE